MQHDVHVMQILQARPQYYKYFNTSNKDTIPVLYIVIVPNIQITVADYVKSLWPSDAIWQHRSGSTLAKVMACCLAAPSHYLNHG